MPITLITNELNKKIDDSLDATIGEVNIVSPFIRTRERYVPDAQPAQSRLATDAAQHALPALAYPPHGSSGRLAEKRARETIHEARVYSFITSQKTIRIDSESSFLRPFV